MRIGVVISLLLMLLLNICKAQVPMERFEKANQLYQEESYAEAIDIYESLLSEDLVSSDLHYNLGNAYFRSRKIPRAILHYEKALKIDPAMEDAKHNLKFANSQTIDKIENPPKLFLYRWWDSLINLFSSRAWAYISLLFIGLSLIGFGIYFYSQSKLLKKTAFYFALSFMVCFILSWFIAEGQIRSREKSNFAIITSPTVDINSSPSEGSSRLFVLHEGSKVKLDDSLEGWYEISLPNGNTGWLLKSAVEEI